MVKLSSVAEILNGDRSSNYPSGKDFIAYGIPFINAGHLKNGKIDFSNMDYISKQKYEQLSGAKIQKKDVLLCLRGSLGKYAVAEIDAGAPASSIAVIRPNETLIASEFLTCIISSFLFQKQIDLENNGSSQPNLSASSVANFIIPFPPLDEQKRIAEALSDVDELISSLEKLIEKYKSIKATCLQQMFPQKGETTPKMRLPGFTGAWEQRKLGEMGQTYTGLSGKTKDDFGHGQARFVTYMNVFSNPISNPEMTEPIEIDPKQNEVEVGDVFFTTSSETPEEVGMSSILLEKRGKTYLNSFCFGFRPSEKIDSYYLAYMLRSESARAKITLLAQGISRYNISKNKVMEIAVSLPSLDEQKMIGQYFSQLDNLITLHQRKLGKVKKIKEGMMQQLLTGKIRLNN